MVVAAGEQKKSLTGAEKQEKKAKYFTKFTALMQEYPRILLVNADNIGSNHMQSIRRSLRGKGVLLMGKNTMVRKCLRGLIATHPQFEVIIPLVKDNIGFIFTKEEFSVIKTVIETNRKQAPAKAGTISPVLVIVPAGNTGLEPTQTSFLQALNIPSKINRGTVEIINDVTLLKIGDKVGASEAALLAKLNILPFSYGLKVTSVYDNGAVFDASILDIQDSDLLTRFNNAVRNVAAVSLATNQATLAAVPHLIINGYKNVLALSLATDYTIKQTKDIKAYLANPSAFAAAAPAADKKDAKKDEKKEAPKKEEKKKEAEPEPEEEGGMFDLFG